MDYIQGLTQVFNALYDMNVNRDNTLIMADCLRALQQIIVGMQQEAQTTQAETANDSQDNIPPEAIPTTIDQVNDVD